MSSSPINDLLDKNGQHVDKKKAVAFIDQSVQKLINLVESDFDVNRYGHFNMREKMKMMTLSKRYPEIIGNKPTEVLETYMKKYLDQDKLQYADPRDLITTMKKVWNQHCLVNYWVKRFFYQSSTPLDPRDEPETKGHSLFYRNIFVQYQDSLAEEFHRQLMLDRQGERIDRSELKTCSEMFKRMDSVQSGVNAYKHLETTLIRHISEYASSLANTWIVSDTISDYLRKSQEFVESELRRCSDCLENHTQTAVRGTLETVLVKEKKDEILYKQSGLEFMLQNDRRDDLARLYFLFQRVKKGLEDISKAVQKFITNAGLQIVRQREQRIQEESSRDTNVDVEYVKQLLRLLEEWREKVRTAFDDSAMLQSSLQKAFEAIINTEAKFRHDNVELLATYSDQVLKGGIRLSEAELEAELKRIADMVKFILAKDVFVDIYRNLLAKRLLSGRTASQDAEKSMISKLKLQHGAQYTSKLEGMLREDDSCATQMEQFAEWRDREFEKGENGAFGNIPQIVFNVRVLTQGWWPNFVQVGVRLPDLFETCERAFEQYYYNNSQNKKLTWQNSEGSVVLKGKFMGKQSQGSTSYEITVKTLQAVFLLLLDAAGDRSFKLFELVQRSQISTPDNREEDITKRVMHSLSCNKHFNIVEKNPANSKIKPEDTFKLNNHFSARKRRFQIPMASLEEAHDPRRVESDRRAAIDAAIVRIMKTRQTVKHQDLIGEVSSQLQFFSPDLRTVRRRIEHCINQEYMERDSKDHTTYHYVA